MLKLETANDWLSLSANDKGRAAERVVQHVLINSYIMHTPLFLIDDNGAPRIRGIHEAVLPDIQMHMRQANVYLDVKCKSRSVAYHVLKEERHGIDRDVFIEYQRSAWVTRSDAGLAIVELCRLRESADAWSGAILFGSFGTIGMPREGHGKNSGEMVYWPRTCFTEICKFSPSTLANVMRGQVPSGFSKRKEIERIFAIPSRMQGMLW